MLQRQDSITSACLLSNYMWNHPFLHCLPPAYCFKTLTFSSSYAEENVGILISFRPCIMRRWSWIVFLAYYATLRNLKFQIEDFIVWHLPIFQMNLFFFLVYFKASKLKEAYLYLCKSNAFEANALCQKDRFHGPVWKIKDVFVLKP